MLSGSSIDWAHLCRTRIYEEGQKGWHSADWGVILKWLKLCLFASFAKWCIDWLVLNCLERIRILDCRITHFWMEILWLEIWILSSKNGRQGYGYHMVPSPEASSLTASHIPDLILICRPWNEFQRLMMPCHLEAMSFNTQIHSQYTIKLQPTAPPTLHHPKQKQETIY